MSSSAWLQERPRAAAELTRLQSGQGDSSMSQLAANTLVLAANAVGIVMIGERLNRVQVIREPIGGGGSTFLVGWTYSSLLLLPHARREQAMRAQPETVRAYAIRALNALTTFNGRAYVAHQLRYRQPGVSFCPGEADATVMAEAVLEPFMATPKASGRASNLVYLVDAADRSDQRWETTLMLATHLVGNGLEPDNLHGLIASHLVPTPAAPLPHLYHPVLSSVIDVLCRTIPPRAQESALLELLANAMEAQNA